MPMVKVFLDCGAELYAELPGDEFSEQPQRGARHRTRQASSMDRIEKFRRIKAVVIFYQR
jgi:hypothetical protein